MAGTGNQAKAQAEAQVHLQSLSDRNEAFENLQAVAQGKRGIGVGLLGGLGNQFEYTLSGGSPINLDGGSCSAPIYTLATNAAPAVSYTASSLVNK